MCQRRKCLNCDDIVVGRADKKFCGVECKTNYNNERYRDQNNLMRNINRTLKANRIILRNLYTMGRTHVRRESLEELGFKFTYFTNVYLSPNGQQYNFCYEQGLCPMKEGKYQIVSKGDLVDFV